MQRDFFSPLNFPQFFLSVSCLPVPISGQTGASWYNDAVFKLSQTFAPVSSVRWELHCVMKPCPPHQNVFPHTMISYRKGDILGFLPPQIFQEIYFAVFPRKLWIQTCEAHSFIYRSYRLTGLVFSLSYRRPLKWFISLLHWIHKHITRPICISFSHPFCLFTK